MPSSRYTALAPGMAAGPGAGLVAGWNCTRILRPIDVEYTSRYSTGRPSRENAFAVGVTLDTTAMAGIVRTAAHVAIARRSQVRTALYRPFMSSDAGSDVAAVA